MRATEDVRGGTVARASECLAVIFDDLVPVRPRIHVPSRDRLCVASADRSVRQSGHKCLRFACQQRYREAPLGAYVGVDFADIVDGFEYDAQVNCVLHCFLLSKISARLSVSGFRMTNRILILDLIVGHDLASVEKSINVGDESSEHAVQLLRLLELGLEALRPT
jgi:hypothetical protein